MSYNNLFGDSYGSNSYSNNYGLSGNYPLYMLTGFFGLTCRNPFSETFLTSYAKTIAYKSLAITYIVMILCAHLHLMVNIFRKYGRFFYRQQLVAIVLSLSFGDMLLALFSLVVEAEMVFEKFPSCIIMMNANVYKYSFLPFVHGMGLTTMAIEIVLRHRVANKFKKWPGVPSVIYSFLPWLAGLVIALPVATADRGSCPGEFTLDRDRAILIVCIILPSLVAVIVSAVVLNSKTVPVSEDNAEAARSQNAETVFSTASSQQPMPGMHVIQNTAYDPKVPGSPVHRNHGHEPNPDYDPHPGYPQPHPGYQQPHPGYPQLHPGYPQPHPGYPQAHPGYPQYPGYPPQNPSVTVIVQTPGSQDLAKQKMVTEKRCVVNAASAFLCLSIIYPLYELIVVTNPYVCILVFSVVDDIISSMAYWLLISRAAVSAIIFRRKLT